VDDLQQLQSRLGYAFRDGMLLHQALVHRSYLNESAPLTVQASNERLEFLGDAVLGMLIAEELYRRFPVATEGQLTEMRAQLVRGAALAEVGEALEIGRSLVMGRGEERSGGRRRAPNLGRALEALIGAIYLDGGLKAVRDVIDRLFEAKMDLLKTSGSSSDSKSALQRYSQASLRETPEYVTVSMEGPADSPEFVVEVHVGESIAGAGRGRTKRQAQQQAASQALLFLSESGGTDSAQVLRTQTTNTPTTSVSQRTKPQCGSTDRP
jgi:ribonuclease-3